MKTSSLYPLLFDAIADPLVLIDERGEVLLANASATSFFDFGAYRALRSTTCTEPNCVLQTGEITALMTRHESVRDYQLKSRDGREIGVSMDIDSVRLANGKPIGKLLHFRNRSAERRNDLWRDEIISMVSHEIKNPLSAMKSSVDILLSQIPGKLTEGQKRFLNTSGRNIDRLTHLLDGFLDVSRINSGAFELKRGDVDLRQFINDVIRSFTTLFNVKRVKLDWHVDAEVSKAYFDPEKLEQVVINLLSNALKFTPEDGEIAVSIGPAGVEKIGDDLRLLPWDTLGTPRLLEVVVIDNGLGMSSETLDNLFDRYHKDNELGDGKGAHLGLNISKKLIEAQDGWLDVVSQLGIGTKVAVYVPRDRHTACVLSRMSQVGRLVERVSKSRGRFSFFVCAKQDAEHWEDVCGSWRIAPVVNADPDAMVGESLYLWTVNASLAIAILLDGGDGDAVETVFGPNFELCGDKSYMLESVAFGACHGPLEAATFAQVCNIAAKRMQIAREALVRSMTDLAASGIESVVVDLGR